VLLVDAHRNQILESGTLIEAPLGLLAVQAAIRQACPEVTSRILEPWDTGEDASFQEWFRRQLRTFEPAIVGISAFSRNMPDAIRLADMVREFDPQVPVILGGQHATVCPNGIGQYQQFDYYVIGRGTASGPALINHLFDGFPSLEAIRSVSYRQDGVAHRTEPTTHSGDLDDDPAIAWDDLELPRYVAGSAMGLMQWPVRYRTTSGTFIPYIASTGCGYRCSFCERSWGTHAANHSVPRVIEDLKRARSCLPSDFITLLDPFIHRRKDWFRQLLDAFRRELPGVRFAVGVRADNLDLSVIDEMIDVGVRLLMCYPESGASRIRQLMNKRLDPERFTDMMSYASGQGALVHANFIVGWPGETLEEARASIALAREAYFDFASFYQLVYLGGAEIRTHLNGLGIEVDTPAYFQHLAHPGATCLAQYSNAEYADLVSEGNSLNQEKLMRTGTQAKLSSLGLTVELEHTTGKACR
jgi:radical SAM superfamily enzyme YgiQ (UPF0313 family)